MCYTRRAKIMNEMRQYYATIYNDYCVRIRVRGRRKGKEFLYWYDWGAPQNIYRNWKSFRPTQWRMRKLKGAFPWEERKSKRHFRRTIRKENCW